MFGFGSPRKAADRQNVGLVGNALLGAGIVGRVPACPDHLLFRGKGKIKDEPFQVVGGAKKIVPLTVDRKHLFSQALSYYKKPPSKKHVQLMISFRSDGVIEEGLDGLGLRREFYSTLFKECLKEQSNMFVGSARSRLPSNYMTVRQNGSFEALGNAIVTSILNGDCGFPYLAPVVFYYLVDEDYTEFTKLERCPGSWHQMLLKTKTNDDIVSAMDCNEGSVIDHIGWPPGQAFTMKNRNALVEQLILWSIIEKRKTSLDKVKKGLNHMGFLDATRRYPQLLPLLVYSQQYSVSAKYVMSKFLPPVESLVCTNKHEIDTKGYLVA